MQHRCVRRCTIAGDGVVNGADLGILLVNWSG